MRRVFRSCPLAPVAGERTRERGHSRTTAEDNPLIRPSATFSPKAGEKGLRCYGFPLSAFRPKRGFTLLEATIAVLMVGLLMVAALQSAGGAKRRENDVYDRLLARQLAATLMNEILLQAYRDPDLGNSAKFGPEPGESVSNRTLFDDVDDYNGYTSAPPQDRNGSVIAGYSNWSCGVTVAWANPGTLAETTTANTDLKKITVAVSKNGRLLATVISYRSNGWVDTIPKPSDATGNHAPVAVATSPNLLRRTTETVAFSGSGSSDQDGDTLSYVWNFGDGTTAVGQSVNKNYSSAGTYTCTLTVYDGRGGMGTSSLTAIISP